MMSLHKVSVPLIMLLAMLTLMPVAAQEEDSTAVVERFYTWYLDYAGYDEDAEIFRNPIVDGSYRERPELNPALIAAIDAQEQRFADPFLCAQDLPTAAQFEAIDAAHVLVSLTFGNNPHAHTLLVELDDAQLIKDVVCMETVTPEGIVRAFYYTYIEDRDAVQIGDNPLLTDSLNAQLSETLNNPIPLGEGDPVVCAQDRPSHQAVNVMRADDNTAAVLVSEFFANNPVPRLVTVDLVYEDVWQIDAIHCEVEPETIAAYLYNEFVLYRRYDMENNVERTPLGDWAAFPWNNFMDESLYAELLATYASSEPRPADPFLCAQDLPQRILTDVIPGTQSDSVTVRISGAFPAGPDSFERYDLATVIMSVDENGMWRMSAINCAR